MHGWLQVKMTHFKNIYVMNYYKIDSHVVLIVNVQKISHMCILSMSLIRQNLYT